MDFSNIPLFGVAKKRLDYLTRRQEVIASNIANADTPDYRAKDLKEFRFKELIRRETRHLSVAATSDAHLMGQRKRVSEFDERALRKPYETTPNENGVVLEEQMMNLGVTNESHRLASQLYRKHIEMLKMATRSR